MRKKSEGKANVCMLSLVNDVKQNLKHNRTGKMVTLMRQIYTSIKSEVYRIYSDVSEIES